MINSGEIFYAFKEGAEGVRFLRSPCFFRFRRGSLIAPVFNSAVFGLFSMKDPKGSVFNDEK